MFQESAKIRVACGGLVYKKALRISKSSIKEAHSGKVINLLSSDLTRCETTLAFLYDVWKGPIEVVIFFIIIYKEIGIAAASGMLFLISFVLLQGKILNYQFLLLR